MRVGRAAQHPAAADVHHRLETNGLDAAAGAHLRPAGGFAGATTARSRRRRRKQHAPADHAGLERGWDDSPSRRSARIAAPKLGASCGPRPRIDMLTGKVTLAAVSPESLGGLGRDVAR